MGQSQHPVKKRACEALAAPVELHSAEASQRFHTRPSWRKVYIVQACIERLSGHIVIARHGGMELAGTHRRARYLLECMLSVENPADDIRRELRKNMLQEFDDRRDRREEGSAIILTG